MPVMQPQRRAMSCEVDGRTGHALLPKAGRLLAPAFRPVQTSLMIIHNFPLLIDYF